MLTTRFLRMRLEERSIIDNIQNFPIDENGACKNLPFLKFTRTSTYGGKSRDPGKKMSCVKRVFFNQTIAFGKCGSYLLKYLYKLAGTSYSRARVAN